MPNPWFIVGALAVVAVAFWQGTVYGRDKCVMQHQAELLESIEAGQELEAERRRVAQERDAFARQLEEQANVDPIVVNQCLGPNRVRRLNQFR